MIIDQDGRQILDVEYRSEAVLQEVIFQHPELLTDGNNTFYSIKREVNTGAGPVDVLMISDAGDVVVVEVKLRRNGQSRREVVAQIIDYISTFSQYSYHALDAIVNNELSNIVDSNEKATELPKIIDEKLRRGAINLIIAVDEVNDDLRRIMDFLAEHSDFNVSLVEIKQHRNLDGTIFYSSSMIVKPRGRALGVSNSETSYNMEYVCKKWDEMYPSMKTLGSAARFRQIRPSRWPAGLHYEFLYNEGSPNFNVRLDNEIGAGEKLCEQVSEVLRRFNNYQLENGYFVKAIVSQKSDKIMRLNIPIDVKKIDDAVKTMELLIKLTKDAVDGVIFK